MYKTFLKVKDVASLLQLNTLTIYDYIRAGKLKAVRLGRTYRIQKKEFNKFIDKNEVPGKDS